MNVLILGGQSPQHHEWVRRVATALQASFDRVAYLDYRHWIEGGDINIPHEIDEAAKVAADLGEYMVVAKSIGSVIAAFGIAKSRLVPERCIILGFPLAVVLQSYPDLAPTLTRLPPTILVQNEQDPLGSAKAVAEYVRQTAAPQVQFVVTPGQTHDYLDFPQIQKLATGGQ